MIFLGYDLDPLIVGVGVAWFGVVILLVVLFHYLRSN
jgi:hypothetical protein